MMVIEVCKSKASRSVIPLRSIPFKGCKQLDNPKVKNMDEIVYKYIKRLTKFR